LNPYAVSLNGVRDAGVADSDLEEAGIGDQRSAIGSTRERIDLVSFDIPAERKGRDLFFGLHLSQAANLLRCAVAARSRSRSAFHS
jgi:hypothetical protein